MKDLLLDENGDLFLSNDGDVQITDSIQQAISIRLKWFANEWKLGPELGIPYYDEVLTKNPSTVLLEDRFLDAIYGVDDVDEVQSFSMSIDSRSRKLNIQYKVLAKGILAEGRVLLNV